MTAPDEQTDRPFLAEVGPPVEDALSARRSYWPEIAALGTIVCAICATRAAGK